MKTRFLITGATGLVGSGVFSKLRADGHVVFGASRSPKGDAWRYLDFECPESFNDAFAGIDVVMLIARPGDEQADVLAAPLIDAMRTCGVARVCLLSALGAERRPDFSLRKVELLLEESGMQWTHVRPNFFMQMLALPPLATELRSAHTLSLPLDGARVAYVDARDVIDVLVAALVSDRYVGTAIELNGPQALDHERIVAMISAATGVNMQYVALDDSSARRLLAERNFPPAHLERLMRFYALIRAGWCASEDHTVSRLLGHPLRTFETFVHDYVAHWK